MKSHTHSNGSAGPAGGLGEKANYDLAFSLGFSCGGSRALRRANLQFASYPLDWTGSPGVVQSAKMVAADFAGWLDRADLELVDVRAGRFGNHIYRNRKTGFGFPHEFSSFQTFDELYAPTVEKHRRRIERLMAHVRAAKKVLVIYIERPINARAADSDLLEAKRVLEAKFPGVAFGLVYFFHHDGAPVSRTVAPDVTAVDCAYRQMANGEVWHEIDYGSVADWLSEHAAVTDPRTEAEKADYAAKSRRRKGSRFAAEGNPFRRKLNELEYKLYRHLEESLQAKGVLPRDRALWF